MPMTVGGYWVGKPDEKATGPVTGLPDECDQEQGGEARQIPLPGKSADGTGDTQQPQAGSE